MKVPRTITVLSLFLGIGISISLGAKSKAPDWLTEAAKAPDPEFDPKDKPEIVVLWDEGSHDFLEDGTLVSTIRYAIRIIKPSGVDRARAYAYYRDGSDKITKIEAWVIDKGGDIHTFKKNEIEDIPTTGYSLYSESRAKKIDGKSKSRTGTVFGYEYTQIEKSIFTQHRWYFQSIFPVVLSRLKIDVPEGWDVGETRFHDAPSATINVGSYVWEMRDLEAVKSERNAPYRSLKRSFITIDVKPPNDGRVKHSTLSFGSWGDIASYTAEIQDPQITPDAAIEAKARELTEGVDDVWGKVSAIGEYVKELRYASISMDLDQGGGYTPRPATEVFRVGYGDCKDKSNLLRSMLKVVGLNAYPVVVNATDNDRVYPDWPSPYYFNHCIAAVEVDESVDTPAVIEDEELGRLLFVDPTSSLTPIGELPFDEQGGLTVIGKHGVDRLIRLPQAPPEANKSVRKIISELLPNGAIIGTVNDQYHGKNATDERTLRLEYDEKEYQSAYERWLSEGNNSAKVKLRKIEDNAQSDRTFEVELEFAIPKYAKNMRNQLLIFKPAIISRRDENPYQTNSRTTPVRISPSLLEEDTLVYLPHGFLIDEMKEEILIDSDFARYEATLKQEDDTLLYKRSLRFNDTIVSVEDYPKLQEFYRKIIEADQTPVVLVRASG